jgi:serine/threonine protein kinase
VGKSLVDDRYELRALAGSGGMAYVFLAYDRVLGRDVALKLLKDRYAEDEGFVERFRREAKSAAALSSPFIVPSSTAARPRTALTTWPWSTSQAAPTAEKTIKSAAEHA